MISVFVATEYSDLWGTHEIGEEVSFPKEGKSAVEVLIQHGVFTRVRPLTLPDLPAGPPKGVKAPVASQQQGPRNKRT